MEKIDLSIFKAYDIRGVYPDQIDADLIYKIAQAYAKFLSGNFKSEIINPKSENEELPDEGLTIVVGHDMRLSGEEFSKSVINGLIDAGVNVIDIGLVSTDMLYFAAATLDVDGGIQITASHNPKEFGGMKLVGKKGRPISGDTGIYEIRDLVNSNFPPAGDHPQGDKLPITNKKGKTEIRDITKEYFEHVFSKFDTSTFKNFKVVANTNFGMGNLVVDHMKNNFKNVEFVRVVYESLNGNFPLPLGRPDPLIPENRQEVISAIKELKPDLGVAWDADADRCFFFDETGQFITPAYINALLSGYYLQKYPGGKIVHDTRVVRVIDQEVKKHGGQAVTNKAGHSFIKERMMKEDAVFGSESSAHYYFKDNFYLDNGVFPFLAVLDILSQNPGKTFSQILQPLREKFFISEEMNFKTEPEPAILKLKEKYKDAEIGEIDGFDFNYKDWRFNVRKSNTESLLRVNIEANSKELLEEKVGEINREIEK